MARLSKKTKGEGILIYLTRMNVDRDNSNINSHMSSRDANINNTGQANLGEPCKSLQYLNPNVENSGT